VSGSEEPPVPAEARHSSGSAPGSSGPSSGSAPGSSGPSSGSAPGSSGPPAVLPPPGGVGSGDTGSFGALEVIIHDDGSVTFVDLPPELLDIAHALNPDDPLVCERREALRLAVSTEDGEP
jgi:hypothetical protein